jgi:hypothetical protein
MSKNKLRKEPASSLQQAEPSMKRNFKSTQENMKQNYLPITKSNHILTQLNAPQLIRPAFGSMNLIYSGIGIRTGVSAELQTRQPKNRDPLAGKIMFSFPPHYSDLFWSPSTILSSG